MAAAALARQVHQRARQVHLAALNASPWVSELPLELALQVFGQLDPVAIAHLRRTCQAWRLLVDAWSDDIWGAVTAGTFGGHRPSHIHGPTEVWGHETYVQYRKQFKSKVPKALHLWAVTNGHHRLITRMIRNNEFDVHGRDTKTNKPYLYIALEKGRSDVVRTLLAHGALLDDPGVLAVLRGESLANAMAILEHVIDAMELMPHLRLNFSELPLDTMLRTAAGQAGDRVRLCRWLLDVGAPRETELRVSTALAQACGAGNIQIIELLLAAGATLDPMHGYTPLTRATEGSSNGPHLQVMRLLLDRGAVACGTREGREMNELAPHAALKHRHDQLGPGYLDAFKLLLERDPQGVPRSEDERSVSVIQAAAILGHIDALRLLVARDPTLLDLRGRLNSTPFMSFCYARSGERLTGVTPEARIACLDFFIETMGAERCLAARNDRGFTALAAIISSSEWSPLHAHAVDHTCLREQLNTRCDDFLANPLELAVGSHRVSPFELLKRGALVTRTQHAWTPLMNIYEATDALIEALIAAGDDVNNRNDEGNTPLMTADSPANVGALLRHGADPHALGENGESVLMRLAHLMYYRAPEYYRLMRDYGLDLNYKSPERGENLLFYVPTRLLYRTPDQLGPKEIPYFSMVSLLVRLGVDHRVRNIDGQSPRELNMGRMQIPDLYNRLWDRIEAGEDLVEEGYAPRVTLDELCALPDCDHSAFR